MAKKIEGYVYSNNVPTEGGNRLSDTTVTFFPSEDPNPQMTHKAVLVIHDGPSERVYLESEVRAAAMAEPELPGNMPDEMWEACRSDRATMQEAMRVVVRLTRDGILERIGITL